MTNLVQQNFLALAATRSYTHQGTPEREREFQAARERVTHRAAWQEPLPGCIQPVKQQTFLESMGCCPHDTGDEYVALVQSYMDGDMKWEDLMASLPVHKCKQCRGVR